MLGTLSRVAAEQAVRAEAAASVADTRSASPWMEPAPANAGLRASCLVNNYDYGGFVVEAVSSALAQTSPFDEIVVVDDGSTDDSCERLRAAFSVEPRVVLIAKENEGQLSCFHRGLEASTGDLVFFLDADDRYEPRYLERLREIYRSHPECHFAVSAYRTFGREEREVRRFDVDRDLGYSAVLALTRSLTKLWVSPTSTLSMRRPVLERFLPLPHLEDWRTRADDCLLFGSSLAGARKYYSAEPLVGYRIHGHNHWYGRAFGDAYEADREAAVDRLLSHLTVRLGLDGLAARAHEEFALIDRPALRQLRHYARIALRSDRPPADRAGMVLSMARRVLAP